MSIFIEQIIEALKDKAIPSKAEFLPKFFKSFPGGYGEGDQFLGVIVPDQRKIAKTYFRDISLDEVSEILQNPFHEVRLTALMMLVITAPAQS